MRSNWDYVLESGEGIVRKRPWRDHRVRDSYCVSRCLSRLYTEECAAGLFSRICPRHQTLYSVRRREQVVARELEIVQCFSCTDMRVDIPQPVFSTGPSLPRPPWRPSVHRSRGLCLARVCPGADHQRDHRGLLYMESTWGAG